MERDLQGVRTGRASTSLVERIQVDYYGTQTPLNQLAGISVPEAHQIVIQPWDRSVLGAIGYVDNLNGSQGSVSIVGAVSPPGGDFSEPVTQHTKSFIRCFWALDKSLASARHFPAINWLDSYSEYTEDMANWWREKTGKDWLEMRNKAMELLSEEARLFQIVKLVGPDALPYAERMVLETTRLIREGILQQNATDPVDAYSSVEKQIRLLELVHHFHERGLVIVKRGAPINLIHDLPVVDTIIRAKSSITNEEVNKLDEIWKMVDEQMGQLDAEYR